MKKISEDAIKIRDKIQRETGEIVVHLSNLGKNISFKKFKEKVSKPEIGFSIEHFSENKLKEIYQEYLKNSL